MIDKVFSTLNNNLVWDSKGIDTDTPYTTKALPMGVYIIYIIQNGELDMVGMYVVKIGKASFKYTLLKPSVYEPTITINADNTISLTRNVASFIFTIQRIPVPS